jgi:DEAD/DEAH box helicase domain-containing protein
LIRRLKERLDMPRGDLCVVGTSATLDDREPPKDAANGAGDGAIDARETSVDRLARFASTLFEEDIQADAVIGEDRLTVEEIIAPQLDDVTLPAPQDCDPLGDEDALQYAQRQAGLWGGPAYAALEVTGAVQIDDAIEQWTVALGRWLKRLRLFKALLDLFQQHEANGAEPLTWRMVIERLARADLSFNDLPQYDDRSRICASFFALIAYAKEIRSDTAFPLVPTQVQLWIRELRRLGRVVSDKPAFSWLDEPTADYPSLPTFHCSECGESGWMALHDPSEDTHIGAQGVSGFKLDGEPARIYQG